MKKWCYSTAPFIPVLLRRHPSAKAPHPTLPHEGGWLFWAVAPGEIAAFLRNENACDHPGQSAAVKPGKARSSWHGRGSYVALLSGSTAGPWKRQPRGDGAS